MKIALRGGSWRSGPRYDARASNQGDLDPADRRHVGFRCCVKRCTRPLIGLRGGSWPRRPRYARASLRYDSAPANRLSFVGFRCCVYF